ncbi:MAG: polysaccharide pyruvyl transferase family protein [Candidatus Thiodiazotropha sp. (ex Lucinoma kastoroae)]|nr:polysaccharide pyruvyl transferase family protein [Candidatus Thiodiazotropha sp. (ex Lucinoma kastoroae)]
MIKILIPEDIPSANKGEAALFFGMIESLKVIGPHKITLFSLHPENDHKYYGDKATLIDSTGITPQHMLDSLGSNWYKLSNYLRFLYKHTVFLLLHPLLRNRILRIMQHPVWRAYIDADLILMSHDSFYTPFYHGPLILFFRLLGKRVMLYAATIIPPHPYQSAWKIRFRNWFNSFVLSRAHVITLRETLSYDYVKGLGVEQLGTRVECHADLAFILPPVGEEEINRIFKVEKLPQKRPLIGVAFTQRKLEFAFPDIPSKADRQQKALAPIVKMIDYLTGELDATVVFVPHSIGPTPKVDDRITADWIQEKASSPEKLKILRSDYTPNELKGLASRLDLTIGARLHFTIDATSQGVPSLLITHREDFRCHGIIGETLNQQDYIYNIEDIHEETLIPIVRKLWENRKEVREYLLDQMTSIQSDVYQHGHLTKELLEKNSK